MSSKVLQRTDDLKALEANIKNKWNWSWMQEKDRFKETYIIFSPKQQFFKLVNSGLKYQFSGFLSSLFLSKASACTPAGALPLDPAGGCAPRPLLVFRLFGGYLVASLIKRTTMLNLAFIQLSFALMYERKKAHLMKYF